MSTACFVGGEVELSSRKSVSVPLAEMKRGHWKNGMLSFKKMDFEHGSMSTNDEL